ncbi:MAG TPA: TonB family protein [Vicinamibacteria bacterium]|nr:TonB family protein [Vicinamibacteria bacterium]
MGGREPLPSYFGRYQVLEELGAGAMGVVYLCVDPRLARPVAIKVMRESEHTPPEEREQQRARFRNEVEAAGRLNHPDIVQIFDIGPAYLVMEFIEGRPLSGSLRGGTTLTVQKICSIVLRVADALDYAHKHGIVHRDIKPANIMVSEDGGVKVTDFGVARLDTSNLTQAGTVVGSVRYMAPEQMLGEKVDGRADVFSLAAVAYELLTSQPPYPGKTITEVVGRVVHGAHVPPRLADQRLPPAVDPVFARAFTVRPKDRYPTAMDFARDLFAALQDVLSLEVVHRQEGEDGQGETVVQGGHPRAPQTPTVIAHAPTTRMPATTRRAAVAPPAAAAPRKPAAAAPPPAAPTTPIPRTEGALLLDSDPPGAQVYVDGTPVGHAPLSPVEVTFGRHVVRMEAPGREAVSAEVEVKRDRPLRVLTIGLPGPRPQHETLRAGQFVPFGPGVTPPKRVAGSLPVYPPAAQERGMEGVAAVDVWIDEEGNVIDVAIVESAGALLDTAVLEAVAGWRFSPATLRGVPVSVRMTLQHIFRQ